MGKADDREGQEDRDRGAGQGSNPESGETQGSDSRSRDPQNRDPQNCGSEGRDPDGRDKAGHSHELECRSWYGPLALKARAAHIERALNLDQLDGEELQRTLGHLHHAKQRALLMQAIEIQMERTPAGRLLGGATRPPLSVDRWRGECGLEIEQAMADGFGVAGELLACVVLDPSEWPSTESLGTELESLHPGLLTQWMLLRVHSMAGDVAGIHEVLGRINSALLPGLYRVAFEECVGITAEREGQLERAAVAFESADRAGGGCRILFARALIALELGREPEFRAMQVRLQESSIGSRCRSDGFSDLKTKRELIARPIDPAHLARLALCCSTQEREAQKRLGGSDPARTKDSLSGPQVRSERRASTKTGEGRQAPRDVPPDEDSPRNGRLASDGGDSRDSK
jgi:hypothetical protein